MNSIKQLLVYVAVFAVTYFVAGHFLPIDAFDMNVHGWGWAVLILGSLLTFFVVGFVKGMLAEMFKDIFRAAMANASPAFLIGGYVVSETISWMTIGLGFIVSSKMSPTLVVVSPAASMFSFYFVIGLSAAVASLISVALGYSKKLS